MLLGNQKKIRESANKDWTIIIKEIECNGKIYCLTHINFETSLPIHDTFENVCKKYGVNHLNLIGRNNFINEYI